MEHGMVFRRIRYFEYGLGLPMLRSSFKIHFETLWYINNLQDTFKYSLSFKYRYNSVENVMFVSALYSIDPALDSRPEARYPAEGFRDFSQSP
jgi:hypothetical protein